MSKKTRNSLMFGLLLTGTVFGVIGGFFFFTSKAMASETYNVVGEKKIAGNCSGEGSGSCADQTEPCTATYLCITDTQVGDLDCHRL